MVVSESAGGRRQPVGNIHTSGAFPTATFPRILGIECVGVVADSTTPTLVPGQKVAALMGGMGREFDGGYAEYILLPNDRIWPIHTSFT